MSTLSKVLRSLIVAGVLILAGFVIGSAFAPSAAQGEAESASNAEFVFTGFEAPQVEIAAVPLPRVEQTPNLSEADLTRADLYEAVAPSVVSISVVRSFSAAPTLEEFDASSGSGFVLNDQGHIITNYHVIDNAETIVVRFYDGTITRAETVGLDADSDIAVIQVDIPQERLVPVAFGSVDNLRVGESVVAIGSPFGQDWTLTSGIISAKNRSIRGLGVYSIGAAIQTDAPINPGNSGGPLLNMRGEVIGVTSQILSRTRSNSGIGFAVPSDLVMRVASELIENGRVAYSYIGISGGDIGLAEIERGNLADNQRGVVVCRVERNSPAASSELRPDRNNCSPYANGDIIVSINGQEIVGFDALISYLARDTRPGDTVTFGVLRNGDVIDVQVMLGNRPAFE